MPASLNDASLLEHDDLTRLADGRQPVRDDEDRPIYDETGERLLDQVLRLRIHG